jgi:hypothetical protein
MLSNLKRRLIMQPLAEASTPLDGLASAASVILLLEAGIMILLLAILMVLLAILVRWLSDHVIQPVEAVVPRVKQAVDATDRTTGRIIDIVTDFYGRRQAMEAAARAFFDGLIPSLDGEHKKTKADADATLQTSEQAETSST